MKKMIFNTYAVFLFASFIYATILMTEPGQALAIAPRDWILTYYANFWSFIALQAVAFGGFVYLHLRWSVWKGVFIKATGAVMVLAAWLSVNIMPTVFPTVQHSSNYYTVTEAADKIDNDEVVYVIAVDDEVRVFPKTHVEIPHVAGWTSGDTDYAITYCGLSNLPMVIESDYGYGKSDFKILTQVANNLIFKDSTNGNAIQRITMKSEIAENSPTVVPNTMMTWADAQERYPGAKVFVYDFAGMLDPLMADTFEKYIAIHQDPELGFLFETVKNTDDRMESYS